MKVGSRSCIPCSFSVQQHLNPSIQCYHLNNHRSFCRLWGTSKSVKSPDPPLPQVGRMPSSVTEVVWCLTGMPGHRPRSTGELSISQGTDSLGVWQKSWTIQHEKMRGIVPWYCWIMQPGLIWCVPLITSHAWFQLFILHLPCFCESTSFICEWLCCSKC